jgi:NTP pyrophosphatase (non-canonical NTP hydrolase)
MNWIEYRNNASRTFADVNALYSDELTELRVVLNELHCAVGIQTEIHEYGLAVDSADMVNASEEIGDALWYIANLENILGLKKENIQENIIVEWDMGLFELSNELLDCYKKKVFYKTNKHNEKILSYINAIKAMLIEMCSVYGFELRKLLETNINKLRARYPEKFNTHDADNRNLNVERKILEEGNEEI